RKRPRGLVGFPVTCTLFVAGRLSHSARERVQIVGVSDAWGTTLCPNRHRHGAAPTSLRKQYTLRDQGTVDRGVQGYGKMGLNGARAGGRYMAWHRAGLRRYYYRNQNVAGRSVRRYIGTGPVAELAAAADELRKLKRAVEARERQGEQVRHRQAEAPLLSLCGVTDVLTRAALVAAGYYRHDRGAWRRCPDLKRTP